MTLELMTMTGKKVFHMSSASPSLFFLKIFARYARRSVVDMTARLSVGVWFLASLKICWARGDNWVFKTRTRKVLSATVSRLWSLNVC